MHQILTSQQIVCDQDSFLGLAENVGDGFAYEILPVKDYSEIPLHRGLHTVMSSVVRQRELTEFEAPFITLENLV